MGLALPINTNAFFNVGRTRLGVAKAVYSGGGISVRANTPALSSTTGSLVVVGGVGVALNIYAGGAIVAEGATEVLMNPISPGHGSLLTKVSFALLSIFCPIQGTQTD